MGDIVLQGHLFATFPLEACCRATIRLIEGRYLLLLEREVLIAPIWLGPQDASNVLGAILSIMPCADQPAPEAYEDDA